jgi:hypothetical protein
MPDYWQRDPAYGGFPPATNPGANYCVPTSMSNSIMWFDDHGYDWLVPNTADRKKDQFNLINVLAGPNYCKTDPVGGSSVGDYVPGLQQWFDDRVAANPGKTPFKVKYQGLGYTGDLWTGVYAPTEEWIKSELAKCEDVILRVGWYEDLGGTLYRMGGHGVTFVGYDDTDGQFNPGDLIIHDPDDGTAVVTDDNYALGAIRMNVPGVGERDFMLIEGYGGPGIFAIIDGALSASPIPEPATIVVWCTLSAIGITVYQRRRKRGTP